MAALVVLSVVVPLVFMVAEARHHGLLGHGRDFMPLWVGVLLYAAATQDTLTIPVTRRLSAVMTVSAGFGLAIGFWWSLHRSSVGVQGPYLPWHVTAGGWRPPVPATILDLLEVIAVILLGLWVHHLAVTVPPDRSDRGPMADTEQRFPAVR